ncbi:unnamed protein product [Schistocephalus solidus]|uniref:Homeobox domain-containing protein n=1 Tax=Schistocephalus solidus TaxID=70667 RepID=A0A183SQQ2_SCHSO|nr:unnamed protein product [Schistocephalus solidus]
MPNAPRKAPTYQMLDPGLVSSAAATSYLASFVGPLEDMGNVIYTNGQVTNVTTPVTTTNTHNPLLYTSYDPTIVNGALYSDCPTYDSPQSRQPTPNQAPPLPPVPATGVPSRPQLKTNSFDASASRSGLVSTPKLTEADTGNSPGLSVMEAMTGCYAGTSLFEGADLPNAGAGFDASTLSSSNLSGGVNADGLSAAAAAVLQGRLLEANAQNLLFAHRRLPLARMRPVYQNQTLAYGRHQKSPIVKYDPPGLNNICRIGRPVEANSLARIFEKYNQDEQSTSRKPLPEHIHNSKRDVFLPVMSLDKNELQILMRHRWKRRLSTREDPKENCDAEADRDIHDTTVSRLYKCFNSSGINLEAQTRSRIGIGQ